MKEIQARNLLFVNKKKQKNFHGASRTGGSSGDSAFAARGEAMIKVFARFFQKAPLPFFPRPAFIRHRAGSLAAS
jgi:hypothetical protein